MIKQIKKIFNFWKKVLKIRGWKPTIVLAEDLGESAAEVYTVDTSKEFTVLIDKNYNEDIKELNHNILHELIHVFLAPYVNYITDTLLFIKNNPNIKINYDKIFKQLKNREEKIVEKLTKILLEHINYT